MAFADIRKENMGNATSIFNLLRNIAGSFGIALMTTVLARRAYFHQGRLAEQLNPFDSRYQLGVHNAVNALSVKSPATGNLAANGVIYQQLLRQSSLFSFTDAFYLATLIMLFILPLVFFLKRPQYIVSGGSVH
jgi:MFS transporter, DHA2 family, multidrug resistance protein